MFQEVQTKVIFPLTAFSAVAGLSLNSSDIHTGNVVSVCFFSVRIRQKVVNSHRKFGSLLRMTQLWNVWWIFIPFLREWAEFQELDSTGFSYQSIFLFVWIWVIRPIVYEWFTCIMPFLVTRREIFAVQSVAVWFLEQTFIVFLCLPLETVVKCWHISSFGGLIFRR